MILLKFPFRKNILRNKRLFPIPTLSAKNNVSQQNTPKTRGKFVFLSHNLYIMVMESLKQNDIVIRRTNVRFFTLKKGKQQ